MGLASFITLEMFIYSSFTYLRCKNKFDRIFILQKYLRLFVKTNLAMPKYTG